jgi:hypothetical protein
MTAGLIMAVQALAADRPVTRAQRLGDGQVKIEAAARAFDGCTFIGSVVHGAPRDQETPIASYPVTVRLKRLEGQSCTQVVRVVRADAAFDIPETARMVHVFVLAPDGTLATTQRAPIQ